MSHSVNDLVALMRHAKKSASYKPALLKALTRYAKQADDLCAPLSAIGREFTKLYWNQTVVYHLRQASVLSKEAEAVRQIRAIAAQYRVRSLSELPEAGRKAIDARMSRLLTINVLEAFHASKPASMTPLYQWQHGWQDLQLSVESHRFLRDYSAPLELIANFHWAEFLEGCNRLAPRIVQKVARDGARRGSLNAYLRILQAETPRQCFYCGLNFSDERPQAIDHVIPWSFLLEDNLWDLVLACTQCNSGKSDSLPIPEYLERLIARNGQLFAGRAPSVSGDEIKRLYEGAVSVEWPGFWEP
jgi:HNH endonuclease